jgi:hypothetical protein
MEGRIIFQKYVITTDIQTSSGLVKVWLNEK